MNYKLINNNYNMLEIIVILIGGCFFIISSKIFDVEYYNMFFLEHSSKIGIFMFYYAVYRSIRIIFFESGEIETDEYSEENEEIVVAPQTISNLIDFPTKQTYTYNNQLDYLCEKSNS